MRSSFFKDCFPSSPTQLISSSVHQSSFKDLTPIQVLSMPTSPNSSSTITPELDALSRLTLNPEHAQPPVDYVAGLNSDQRDALVMLAGSNHVVMRAFQVVAPDGSKPELAGWAQTVLAREQQRIQNALTFLHKICAELENAGCPVTVMKSLDHWPDLGNDLDLYTTADEKQVAA